MRPLLGIAAALFLAWLGLTAWGVVHARQHAYAHVELAGSALAATPEAVASPRAHIEFLDAKGATVGRANRMRGLWRVAHADAAIGDCTVQERQGGEAWTACNDALSRETARWIGGVRAARLRDAACVHAPVPVTARVDAPDLFGWWNPLQHGAGLPAPWVVLEVPMTASACAADAPD
jgi:hypothetical protein